MMLVARLKAIAAGLVAAGALVALVGAGAWLAARRQDRPPVATARGRRSVPPPVARPVAWIKGIVVDDRGRPVAGASVSSLWTVAPKTVATKADGTFTLPTDEPRLANQAIIATADSGARQGTFLFDGPAGYKGGRTLPRIVLRPARDVTVTVVDASGTPVQGAVVFVIDLVFLLAKQTTDARGIAVLRVPADAMTQWIFAGKPGVGFDYFENYRSVPAIPWNPPPRTARLVLNGARTVRVRAVDSAGRPVPGVELTPWEVLKKGKLKAVNLSGPLMITRTDEKGVATFDWLPADLQAGTSFLVPSPSYFLPQPLILDPRTPDAELTAHVLRLTRVSGKVTRPDGAPAPGIMVEAQGFGGARPLGGTGRVRSAADGSYTMDLAPEQSYMIAVIDDEWAARTLTGVVVREGVPRAGLDLPLGRGSIIRGRVTAGSDSKPAAGRGVILSETGLAVPPGTLEDQPPNLIESFQRVVDTDDDGWYAFRVGPGGYQLTGPRMPGDRFEPINLTVADGQELERDFHLRRDDRPWRTIRGIVRARDAGGPTIAGAIMVVQPIEDRIPPVHGEADEQGHFELPRLTGRIIVYARSPAGDLAGYAVVGGDDDREVALFARPAATAHGRVVDEHGKPWASVNVSYDVETDLPAVGRNGRPGAGQLVRTDDEGRFTASGLPVGMSCRFWAYAPGTNNIPTRRMEVNDTRPFEVPPLVINRPQPATTNPGTR